MFSFKKLSAVALAVALTFSTAAPLVLAQSADLDDYDKLVQKLEQKVQTESLDQILSAAQNGELGNVQAGPLGVGGVNVEDAFETIQPLSTKRGNAEGPTSSWVQDQSVEADAFVSITLEEGETYLGNNVIYRGFTIDNKIPGPTLIVNEGDIVEFEIINEGDYPHGISIHSANTQTSKYYGNVLSGETRSLKFKATVPGVYMYHCAPGGHAIPIHSLAGQYGMMVVLPDGGYNLEKDHGVEPDLNLYVIQHEIYAHGHDAITEDPMYVMFNGGIFRYIEAPINILPNDHVRIFFLNIGPNIISTLHIVGGVWDTVYWQGHPDNAWTAGQTVLAGPSDSFVIDWQAPGDEGIYLLVTHAFGSATRGAIGAFNVSWDHADEDLHREILAEGPVYTEAEMEEHRANALRIVSPFSPTEDTEPHVVHPWEGKASVEIKGNAYGPPVIKVPVGTEVEWTNEDVFNFFEGEYTGQHDVFVTEGPYRFSSEMLKHAEKFSHVFEEAGEFTYICTAHPYMIGKVIVYDVEETTAPTAGPAVEAGETSDAAGGIAAGWYALPFALAGLIAIPFVLRRKKK